MWYEDYLKKHPYFPRQIGIGALSVLAFTVVIGEYKIEAEQRIYRDDLPAHIYHYESPVNAMCCMASGSGASVSTVNLESVNVFQTFRF